MNEWHNSIKHRPNILKLQIGHQISKVEQEVATGVRREGLEVQQQLVIPNYNTPAKRNHPYKIDLFIPEKKLAVEIDGGKFHQDKVRQDLRDKRILQMGTDTEQEIHLEHLRFDIPANLIYGGMAGIERAIVKAEYINFKNQWITQAVYFIVNYLN